ncbi:MAG: Uma2 family endonuclease [Bacillota bacterium]
MGLGSKDRLGTEPPEFDTGSRNVLPPVTPTQPGRESRLVTYADYAALDDGRRYQVFSGMLVAEPAPTTCHQQIVGNLFRILVSHTEESRAGGVLLLSPVDVVLDSDGRQIEVLQPDIVWVRRERAAIVQEAAIFGVPDLVVEVLSPSSARRDRKHKVQRYCRFGVPHIWLFDPEHRVFEELVRAEDGCHGSAVVYHDQDAVKPLCFPQLVLRLSEVWPRS